MRFAGGEGMAPQGLLLGAAQVPIERHGRRVMCGLSTVQGAGLGVTGAAHHLRRVLEHHGAEEGARTPQGFLLSRFVRDLIADRAVDAAREVVTQRLDVLVIAEQSGRLTGLLRAFERAREELKTTPDGRPEPLWCIGDVQSLQLAHRVPDLDQHDT